MTGCTTLWSHSLLQHCAVWRQLVWWLVAQTGLVTADTDIDIWNDTDTMAARIQHAHVGWIHVIHVRVSCYGGPVVCIVIRYCDTYCDTW